MTAASPQANLNTHGTSSKPFGLRWYNVWSATVRAAMLVECRSLVAVYVVLSVAGSGRRQDRRPPASPARAAIPRVRARAPDVLLAEVVVLLLHLCLEHRPASQPDVSFNTFCSIFSLHVLFGSLLRLCLPGQSPNLQHTLFSEPPMAANWHDSRSARISINH